MDKDEALKLLRGGLKGVRSWNDWRQNNPGIDPPMIFQVNLNKSDLAHANLSHAKFPHCKLMGANLKGADLSYADLSVVGFRDADLSDADLHYANLSRAHLLYTNLSRTDLTGANLVEAILDNANLQDAILKAADLTCVPLKNARLCGANLWGARFSELLVEGIGTGRVYDVLENTDFTNAEIGLTTFMDCDLSTCKGLDTVRHNGTSFLDVSTLLRSGKQVPKAFLRGCGITEMLIEYLPSIIGQSLEFYSCFISYSHEDKLFALRLYDVLQSRGIRCWLDEHQLLPGQDIYEEINRGIRLWDKVLLCCSKASLTSWWVEKEIKTAFDKERMLSKQKDGQRVRCLIPLDLDKYLFDCWESGLKTSITDRIAAKFKGWDKDNAIFEQEFEKLMKALRTDEGRELPPVSKL